MPPRSLLSLTLALGLSFLAPRHGRARGHDPDPSLITRHPIVLAHGIMGFENLGLGRMTLGTYFRNVIPHLRRRGVLVGTVYVGKTNGIEERAHLLKAGIDRMFPTGKVNIIAHSLGGLDARHMITHLGMEDRVASLSTIGTPHRGSYAADWAVNFVGRDMGVEKVLRALGLPVEAFLDLTTERCRAFNAVTPDMPGVRYFSYGGAQEWYKMNPFLAPFSWYIKLKERSTAGRPVPRMARYLLEDRDWGNAVLKSLALDEPGSSTPRGPAGPRRLTSWGAYDGARDPDDRFRRFEGRNDGMVPLSSTPWGETFRVIEMDHFDQIGWITLQNTPRMYEGIVRRLAGLGL